jgi:hypothetical protein
VFFGFRLGEISTPTRYFPEASSINFRRSVKYGLGVLSTSLKFRAQRMKLVRLRLFGRRERELMPGYYQEISEAPTETDQAYDTNLPRAN